MKTFSPVRPNSGFTLVELLVVIGIILILMGLVLAAIPAVINQVKYAKTDTMLQAITVGVNAFYTENGKFPSLNSPNDPAPDADKDQWVGDPGMGAPLHNNALFFTLRNIPKGPNERDAANPKKLSYFSYSHAKISSSGKPRGGFFDTDGKGGIPAADLHGNLYDPWGREIGVILDTNGDERIDLEGIYSDFTGADRVSGKAPRKLNGAFSMGKDETLGNKGDRTYRKNGEKSDDIVSW
jgi:prepilin-type N-terminal cleavage/methylation domain-containing protein